VAVLAYSGRQGRPILTDSYIGVTAHYITKEFTLEEELVGFKRVSGSHSGSCGTNLGQIVFDILKSFNLVNKGMYSTLLYCLLN
jgi:hypothetical protein